MSKVPSILLNVDFYSKGRNIGWIKKHGPEAVLILQAVWLASSQESGLKIHKPDAFNIPFLMMFPHSKIVEVLESALEVGLLEGDENYYWNSQVISDSTNYKSKFSNYSKAAKAREEAKRNQDQAKPEQDSTKILPESDQNHLVMSCNVMSCNDLDHNKLEIALPEFKDQRITNSLGRWQQHRQKIGKPFDQESLNAILRLYQHKPSELADDIDHSISNGWKTLNAKSRDAPRKEKKSTKDTIRELYEEALLEEQNAKN